MRIEFVDHQSLSKLANRNLLAASDIGDLDEIKEAVRNAVKRLSQSQQTVVTMYYFEDASFQQIASETGLPPKQIHKLLRAAKTTLKFTLKKVAAKRWPAVGQIPSACPICLHNKRQEIDRMIREKPDSQSWRMFNNGLFEKFGLKINPPILMRYHIKYHQKG